MTTKSELAKRVREFIDEIKGDIDGCPMNDATHTIGYSHIGWQQKIKLLQEAAALLSGEYVRVPRECPFLARKHLEGKTGVAFLDGWDVMLSALGKDVSP